MFLTLKFVLVSVLVTVVHTHTNGKEPDLNLIASLIPGGLGIKDDKDDASSMYCKICNPLMDMLIDERQSGMREEAVNHIMKVACPFLKSYFGEGVCDSVIDLMLPHLLYVVDNNPEISNKLCGIVLQEYGCPGKLHKKWSIKIQPKINNNKNFGKNKELCKTPFNIVQITDIHYDPNYSPSAQMGCDKPLCCQSDGKQTTNKKDSVGYWGDYEKCDVPINLLTNTLEHVAEEHKFDFVYFTGDLIAHRFWDLKKGAYISSFKTVMNEFKEVFGKRCFPILGNHDIYPLNQVVPNNISDPKFSLQWLYDLCAETWKDLLPDGTNLETIKKGGYYSAKAREGLRVIGLNTNCAYTYNFWLILEDNDPYEQLQWLANTLQEAESNNEKVHILTHIPPGDGTSYIPWFSEYRRIIYRYHHIIEAVFQGHNHIADFNVYYKGETPILLGFSGGSVSPYEVVNPNYRVYNVGCNNYEILNYADYIINITESQHNMENPKWFQSYSFKEEYDVKDMSPKSVDDLINRMTKNETLRMLYFNNKYEKADPSIAQGCDKECHIDHMCSTVTTLYSDQKKCNQIKKNYE